MKPLLTNSYPPLTATLPTCLLPITKLLTTKEQRTIVSLEIKNDLLAKIVYDLHDMIFVFLDNHRIEMKDQWILVMNQY